MARFCLSSVFIIFSFLLELAAITGIFLHMWIAAGIFAVLTALNIRAIIPLHRKGLL